MKSFNVEYIYKHKLAAAALIFAVSVLIYAMGLTGIFEFYDDSALYIILGRSLSQGLGLIDTSNPLAVASNYYPFFYPFLLAVTMKLFSVSILVLKALSTVAASAAMVFVFLLFTSEYERLKSGIALLLVIFSPQIVLYSRLIVSEMPFLLFSTASVYFLTRFAKQRTIFNVWFVVSALAMFCAVYTRLVGISLCLTAVAYFLYRRQLAKAVFLAATAVLIMVPWLLQTHAAGSSAYLNEFAYWTKGLQGFVFRWAYNLAATVTKELPDLFFYPFFYGIDPRTAPFIPKAAVGLATFSLLVLGFVSRVRKNGLCIAETYVLVYVLIFYLSWTHHGARYLLPLLPFLMYYFVNGITMTVKDRKATAFIIGGLVILSASGIFLLTARAKIAPYTAEQRSFIEAGDWLKENSLPGSVVLSRHPSWLSFYADRKGVKFLLTGDPAVQLDVVVKNRVDFVVIDHDRFYRKTAGDYLIPMIKAYPQRFLKVYETTLLPSTTVYQVVRQ